MRALVLTATIHLMACGASSQQVRESSCAVYEKAVPGMPRTPRAVSVEKHRKRSRGLMLGLRGKGVFGRGASLYVNGFVRWALSLGVDWVAVLGNTPSYRAEALAARNAGLRVLLWSGPTSWSPSRWRGTADLLERRALEVGAWGVIADPEDWQNPRVDSSERWGNAGLGEIGNLGDRLALMRRRGLHVYVTSFPSWGGAEGRRVLAQRSGAGGMPQVYSPASPATLLGRADMFRDFRSVVPIPGRMEPGRLDAANARANRGLLRPVRWLRRDGFLDGLRPADNGEFWLRRCDSAGAKRRDTRHPKTDGPPRGGRDCGGASRDGRGEGEEVDDGS